MYRIIVCLFLLLVGGKFCVGLCLSMSIKFSKCPPTVTNPITKRKIHLGGPTYADFMKQGAWVLHLGTLQRLDLDALHNYHEGSPSDQPYCARENSDNDVMTMNECYSIMPLLVSENGNLVPLDDAQTKLLEEQLLFVNKPSGVHSVPSRDLSVDSLSSRVSSLYPNAKPCHRLDRDTSGIVIFGLTPDAHRDVSKQFEARTAFKTYTALIAGHPQQESGIVDLPIGKRKAKEGFNCWTIGGDKSREAITNWHVQKTFAAAGAEFSMVELEPKTGRGHQLRLHMKAMGHPILGDTIHGNGGVAACAPRLCLHAHKLQVDWNGVRLECKSVSPF